MDEFTALFSRKDMTFEEAVAYFKERVPVTASRFYQIAAEYRALAFTVSGYTKAQVLKKFYDELLAALEEGNSLAEFRENMNDFLEAEGYEGITPYQAENIFRTNIQTAYNVGHYKQMTEPGVKALRPYANEGARTKIDELKKVKFSKRSNKAAQGDKSLTVDVDMMIVGGVYQDGVAPV